jgi:hypothetical protein
MSTPKFALTVCCHTSSSSLLGTAAGLKLESAPAAGGLKLEFALGDEFFTNMSSRLCK